MNSVPRLLLLTAILLCGCGAEGKNGASASATFTVDTTHTPYEYAEVIQTPDGVTLDGKHAPGISVGILGRKDGKVFTCKTGAVRKIYDDMRDSIEVTAIDRKFEPDSTYGDMIAVLNYSGQPYAPVKMDTIRDNALVDSLKRLVIESGALKQLYTEMVESRKFDAYARRLFARAKTKTPAVIQLKIPAFSAYLVAYKSDDKYDPENDSDPTLIVINGKAHTASGPCGGVSSVYRFGNNYFLDARSYYCFQDVGARSIDEIRANGLKGEAAF